MKEKIKILQSGVPKSGNYWLYTILRGLIDKSSFEYSSYIEDNPIYEIARKWSLSQDNQAEVDALDILPGRIVNRISRIYEMSLTDSEVDDFLEKTTLSWTHSKFYKQCLDFYKRYDKIVYIVRDPRSVALSSAKFQSKEYSVRHLGTKGQDPSIYLTKNFEMMLYVWASEIISFLEIQNDLDIKVVYYEDLKRHTFEEIKSIAEYLEISISDEEVENLSSQVSIDNMRKKNPEHVRKGDMYEWKKSLTLSQKIKTDLILGPILKSIGYPDRNGSYPALLNKHERKEWKSFKRIKRRTTLLYLLFGGKKYLTSKLFSNV